MEQLGLAEAGHRYTGAINPDMGPVRHRLELDIQSLHAAWVDPDGGVWSVGGTSGGALDAGVAIHNRPIEPITLNADDSKVVACPPDALEMKTFNCPTME